MEVSAAVQAYLAAVDAQIARSTAVYYREVLGRFVSDLAGRNLSTCGDSEWLDAWRLLIRTGLRPRTLRVYRATCCRFLDWCVRSGLLAAHGFREVETGRLDAAHRPRVTVQRFRALLVATNKLGSDYDRTRARALLWTSWSVLLRWSELMALETDHLKLEEDPPRLYIAHGKGGWSGWLPLSDAAAQILRTWLAVRGAAPHRWLWCNEGEQRLRMGRKAWPTLLRRLAQSAGIDAKQCLTHGLRRGSATAMLQSGVDIATVSALLRHRSLLTTQVYVEADHVRLADVRNWLEANGEETKGAPPREWSCRDPRLRQSSAVRRRLPPIG